MWEGCSSNWVKQWLWLIETHLTLRTLAFQNSRKSRRMVHILLSSLDMHVCVAVICGSVYSSYISKPAVPVGYRCVYV